MPSLEHMKGRYSEKEECLLFLRRASFADVIEFGEREGEIKGGWSDGLWRWRGGEGQRLSEPTLRPSSSSSCLLSTQPGLCSPGALKQTCPPRVLITFVTVVYAYFLHRRVLHPPPRALSLYLFFLPLSLT